jgi:thiol-disulfide isomerase/thioredoxin
MSVQSPPLELSKFFLGPLVDRTGATFDVSQALQNKVVVFYFGYRVFRKSFCQCIIVASTVVVPSLMYLNVLFSMFSASWCPPCRKLSPRLAEIYAECLKNPDTPLEVVYVSIDRDEASFNAYLAEQPWKAIAWKDLRFVSDVLKSSFGATESIPHVAVVSADRARCNFQARVQFEQGWTDAYPFLEPLNRPPVGPQAKKADIDIDCVIL